VARFMLLLLKEASRYKKLVLKVIIGCFHVVDDGEEGKNSARIKVVISKVKE
jgi:hypothetical protein